MLRQHGGKIGAADPATTTHEIHHDSACVVRMPMHAVDSAGVRPRVGFAGFDGADVDVAAPLDAIS